MNNLNFYIANIIQIEKKKKKKKKRNTPHKKNYNNTSRGNFFFFFLNDKFTLLVCGPILPWAPTV